MFVKLPISCHSVHYLSIRLQLNLSDHVRSEYRRLPALMHARTKAQSIGSKRKFLIVKNDVALDIRLLTEALQSLHRTSLWERHIGLCVLRDPYATLLSNASYEGLGGYSLYLNFAWRLSSHDLNSMGFKVRLTEPLVYWEPDLDPNNFHINIFELLATIINIILTVCCMNDLPPPSSGWVLHARADNTSALSWTQYASRSTRIYMRLLTHFLSTFLTFSQAQVAFTHTLSLMHCRSTEHGIRRVIPPKLVSHLAIRDKRMRGTTLSPSLPNTMRATVHSCLTHIRNTDKGVIRENNEHTISARSQFFLNWCHQRQFYDVVFLKTSPSDAQKIISSYAFDITSGKNITYTTNPRIKTVQVYVREASAIAHHHSPPQPDYRYEINQLGQQTSVLAAGLQSVFHTITSWYEKNGETQSLTAEIITVLFHLTCVKKGPYALTSLRSALFDGISLTLFTGSRVSDYAQSRVRRGEYFNRVPTNNSTGRKGGIPIAFMKEDFTFFNDQDIQQSWNCLFPPCTRIRVRFCFDKSPRNFSFRTFQLVSPNFLENLKIQPSSHHIPCPVTITRRMIQR